MNEHFYAVIMAGGGGTRLWPVSRRRKPKQALKLFEDRSLFQISVDRIRPIIPIDNIYVVTIAEQAELLKNLVPDIPEENYLIEPQPRGTASVVGLAAAYLQKRDPDAIMACLTADHFMRNETYLRELLQSAYAAANKSFLITLGITPDFPSTGYGYIQRGNAEGSYSNKTAYHVLAFKEKPDRKTAVTYLEKGSYVWNSGMFIWRAERILQEMKKSMPDLHRRLSNIQAALGTEEAQGMINKEWAEIQPQTIDYGVMEKADHVLVIPASDLGWVDIGSWDRLPEVLRSDDNNNVIMADMSIVEESDHVILFQETKDRKSGRLVTLLGVQDLVIIDTDDVLLVCNQKKANEVRKLVQILKERNLEKYL
ncbi:MAG: NTP transferase domain-containing protein [Anaerolineales bacterium]|nr:NTP transferase domain-containing protein [Anaerolineales bacterium]